jgi:outer membrane protein OmpA-like peptidoglycan-associated protein
MNRKILACVGVALLAAGMTAAAQQTDKAGCKDHPLFPTRMPNYILSDCKTEAYGVYDFFSTKGPKLPVEGKFTFLTYRYTGPRGEEPSGLAVVRNYENAIKAIGGTIRQSIPTWWVNGTVEKNGQEIWWQAEKGNGLIWIRIVEKKAMAQDIVADAAVFANGLRNTGHAAVYGILFDTDSAAIKPESGSAISEIAKMLQADPGLKIFVVGHTDATGSVDHNVQLSMSRAQSVKQALVRDFGIAADRLKAFGCGPFAPVASNDSEDGRAKNRRVELVKQ